MTLGDSTTNRTVDLTEKELSAVIQIVEAASIQGQDARFIADLIDKLTQLAKGND